MRTLIICGGTPPTKKLIEEHYHNADLKIGADSGGHVYLGYGFTPDIIIGDLDSFHYTNHENINVLKVEDQDYNDLEKCLQYALDKGSTHCIVLGAFGKRIDHQMKNLSALVQFHSEFESLVFEDAYGVTFMAESPFVREYEIGTVISFFPLSGIVSNFNSTGVLYPLTNSRLEPGIQDGTSNTVTDTTVTVHFDSGKLGVFIARDKKL